MISVRYIADPMCSQCYGIAPLVEELSAYCSRSEIEFSLTMGGLRAGGGVPWDEAFKSGLREEWEDIGRASGRPFNFSFFDLEDFDYDTEPPCRAVVIAQKLLAAKNLAGADGLSFFDAVQEEFYLKGFDPDKAESYAPPCASVGVDFDSFKELFPTLEARQETQRQFVLSRLWGVTDFPTLLVAAGGETIRLAQGFQQNTTVLNQLIYYLQNHDDSPAGKRSAARVSD